MAVLATERKGVGSGASSNNSKKYGILRLYTCLSSSYSKPAHSSTECVHPRYIGCVYTEP
jgi:hypothetical protein